ncbi:transaldolase [Levilactobacillus suantsaii]|uniref:transaldolase family protein n=1 Tax=Levilactobacillus suantsaii TaxID=2292255 RepID=UPI0015F4834A|nr:transaldolase family protein [Levilactobacillus suantsaii]QMU08091.1 transaldolase [Levilactobacillus suantsaii]
MKYFLDSAKLDEIKLAYENYGIDGVTTNPKHIKNSGQPFMVVVHQLADFAADKPDFPISVEVNPHLSTSKEMVTMAQQLHAISANFVIKIPCTPAGLVAARELEQQGIRTNVTLVFSAAQALWPAHFQAKYVSPFVNWQDMTGQAGIQTVQEITKIYRNYDYHTEIIVAAVQSGRQMVDAALSGADIVTAGLAIYRQSFTHPYTDVGLQRFQAAWDQTKKEAD